MCRLRDRDPQGVLAFLPYQDPVVRERFPQLREEDLRESLHLVGPDGAARSGAAALEALAELLPPWRWTGRVFRIPLVRPWVERAYRWVARNRFRLRGRDS